MRKLILVLLSILCGTGLGAQGHFCTDGAFSVGDGKLRSPYSEDLGPSLNFNGHFNFVTRAFLADAGLGALFINDARKTYTGGRQLATELFAEIPVGIGAIVDVGNADLILGGEVSLLYRLGGGDIYFELSPHIDLLWANKAGGRNGFFIKVMLPAGGDQRYQPRYIGLGYKVMYGQPAKKAAGRKAAVQAKP